MSETGDGTNLKARQVAAELLRTREAISAALLGVRVRVHLAPTSIDLRYDITPEAVELLREAVAYATCTADGTDALTTCPTCGVAVASDRQHRAWHATLPARIVAEVDAAGARRLRQS